jgi:predicted transcriptional regulator
MSIQELKTHLYRAIDGIADETLLQRIYAIVQGLGLGEEEWDELPQSTKESIELSLRKVEAGKVIPYEEVLKRVPRLTNPSVDQTDWSDEHLLNSLLSPEDEKNVRRIWKSPGGC